MALLNSEQARRIAGEVLHSRQLTYDETEGLTARLVERPDATPPYWVVSYVSRPGLLEPRDFFIHIEDSTGKVLYILGPHGRLQER